MQQNSEEWLAFRKDKIGASDANIIMGVSEHSTPLDLYLEKKGLPPRKKQTDATFIFDKGHYLEDKIRAEIELETSCDFPPEIRVHDKYEYFMASMDGYNSHWKMGIEAKYVGQESFEKVSNWNPESSEPFPLPQYYPQIQHQYLCSGAVKMAVVAITEVVELGSDGKPHKPDGVLIYILNDHGKKTYKKVIKHVPLNMEYIQNEMVPKLVDFQTNHIIANVEPGATDADIIQIKNLEVGKKVTEYKKNQQKIEAMKAKMKPLETISKKLKTEIFAMELVNAPKMSCKGLTITQYDITGQIDYESAFKSLKDNIENVYFSLENYETMDEIKTALKGTTDINLENFRKSNSKGYKIAFVKPKKEKEVKEESKIKVIEQPNGNATGEVIVDTSAADFKENPAITVKGAKAGLKTTKAKTKKDKPAKTTKAKKDKPTSTVTQQKTLFALNDFKTEKGKTPRNWADKSTVEKIDYLEKLAKRNDTSVEMRKTAKNLASRSKKNLIN